MKRKLGMSLLLATIALAVACGGRASPRTVTDVRGYEEKGIASWYGKKYHGRTTASGERYDMHKMTAAHKTLPFDVVVRVDNLDNGKSIRVRITDRGPFIKGRIIDLSYAAAKKIAMIGPGTAKVRIRVVEDRR